MAFVLVARRPLRAGDRADAGRVVEFVDRRRERPCGVDSSLRDAPGDHLGPTLVMLP